MPLNNVNLITQGCLNITVLTVYTLLEICYNKANGES